MNKIGIFYNKSNDDYHTQDGFWSSSQLSLLFDDPILFHSTYITKTIEKKQKDCYDVGNAFHCKILEPEKFKDEYAYFNGRKSGNAWKVFKEENEGKTILGNKQWLEFETLVKNMKDSKLVKKYIDDSKNEVSIYVLLDGFPIKVRFDIMQLQFNRAADPKSTTGELTGLKGRIACQQKIAGLNYDLSAALYMDAWNELVKLLKKKTGKDYPVLKEWFWIFDSKDHNSLRIFKASELMLENGRTKYRKAIDSFKEYEKKKWKIEIFDERVEEIDPSRSDIIIPDYIPEVKQW